MKKRAEGLIRAAVEAYCLLLFVLLPLYMRHGFTLIGDVKYQLFRNVTILFCIMLSILQFIWCVNGGGRKKTAGIVSRTDILMLGYLVSSLLSFVFSMDRYIALWGLHGWYMGFLSQLMFVWIYFVLSRWCGMAESVRKAMLSCFVCAGIVMVLAVLNRYAFDPLGMMEGMEQGTWEAEHLLSTIGNQNWYCGYVSVAAPVCFYYGYAGGKNMRAVGLAGCLITFLTILTQGSEGGYLILLAMMAVLFVDAWGSRKCLLRFCLTALCCPAAVLLGVQGIRLRGLVLVEDGSLRMVLLWKGWGVLPLLLGGVCLTLYLREKQGRKDLLAGGRIRKAVLAASGILAAIGASVFFLCQVSDVVWAALGEKSLLRITDDWGNDRGALWRMSWECFLRSPWYRKWFGAGPDCFYHALYAVFAVNDVIHPVGQWETAVYANAHNEWLNMLINQGILGMASYVGVFAVSFVRLWRSRRRTREAYWGILAIAGYCAYGTVSFQQITSTPLIFAVLGISEGILRDQGGFSKEASTL